MRQEDRTGRLSAGWPGLLAVAVALCVSAAAVAGGTAAQARPAPDDSATVLIVGGRKSTETYPAMVSLQDRFGGRYEHSCGATLVDPLWAVTAAHCVDPTSATAQVRIGSSRWNSGGEVIKVVRQIELPGRKYDLGLIKLARPARQTPMTIGRVPAPGSQVRMIGWGLTSPDTATSPVDLHEVDTTIVPHFECKAVAPGDLCIDDPGNPGTSACYGDSGGPLAVKQAGRWQLIGATSGYGGSNGRTCKGSSIYTNVPLHRAWIEKTIGHKLP